MLKGACTLHAGQNLLTSGFSLHWEMGQPPIPKSCSHVDLSALLIRKINIWVTLSVRSNYECSKVRSQVKKYKESA